MEGITGQPSSAAVASYDRYSDRNSEPSERAKSSLLPVTPMLTVSVFMVYMSRFRVYSSIQCHYLWFTCHGLEFTVIHSVTIYGLHVTV